MAARVGIEDERSRRVQAGAAITIQACARGRLARRLGAPAVEQEDPQPEQKKPPEPEPEPEPEREPEREPEPVPAPAPVPAPEVRQSPPAAVEPRSAPSIGSDGVEFVFTAPAPPQPAAAEDEAEGEPWELEEDTALRQRAVPLLAAITEGVSNEGVDWEMAARALGTGRTAKETERRARLLLQSI